MANRSLASAAVKRLLELDARQGALFLEGLEIEEAGKLLSQLPPSSVLECFKHFAPAFSGQVMAKMSLPRAMEVLEHAEPQAAANLFRALDKELRASVVENMSPERKKTLQEMLAYPEDSAGRLMTTDFIAFRQGIRVREVIARLRALAQRRSATTYAYVVGPENQLAGVLNMRDLLLAESDASVESTMRTGVVAVSAFTDQEELVFLAREKHYISIPVVDSQGHLIGVVHADTLLESSEEEATEDLQLLFGGSADEQTLSSLSFKVSHRLPWLHINLATAFLAAAVVSLFQGLIERVSVLAVFLPIVAGQGGNAGTQSLAVILRGLVMREIRPNQARQVIFREGTVGIINGAATGAVTALAAWAWKGKPVLGLVVGLAMVVNLFAAGVAGAAIPLAMKRLGFDPAQSSGIFLTTVTDVVGFFSFLSFALLFEGYLA